MTFEDRLSQQMFMPWRTHYLQFDRSKALIQRNQGDRLVAEQWLQSEFDKVHGFLSQKINGLNYQLKLLEQGSSEELDDLILPLYDLHELGRYLNLSMAGFENLSKCTEHCESINFIQSLLVSLDKHSQPLHHLMIRIAHIKQTRLPKTRRNLFSSPLPPRPRVIGKPSYHHPLPSLPDEDQCNIFYFWVHPDHVFELKLMLLFYCAFDAHHTVSSTFFDNSHWEVYHSVLNEQRPSVALCRRTLPGNASTTHTVEVTVKNENGTDFTKRRTVLQPMVDSLFQSGPPPPSKDGVDTLGDSDHYTAMVVEPKTEVKKTNSGTSRLVDSLRQGIQQGGWQPIATCTRQRSTFTPTTDSANPFSIHVDTNMEFEQCGKGAASNKRSTGVCLMVVEQSRVGPEWLKRLVDNIDWIEAVPRFSYHVHSVSTLFRDEVAFLPWWLSTFDRLLRTTTSRTNGGLSWSADLQPLLHGAFPPWHSHLAVRLDDDDDGADDDNRMLLPKPTAPNITIRKSKARWTAKVKVEPKVFFANERTFLSWLQFCALLLTVSLNMINFGGPDDQVSRGCGAMFMILTILMALYALAKYELRAWHLLTRSTHYRFDDVYGPAILCTLLVVAMMINIGLRLTTPQP